MALAAGLHGAVRLSFCRAGKVSQFGANFKVRIIVDNDVIKPFRKISGKIVIETRFPIKHKGIITQFEGMCTLRYSTKFDNRTTFHQRRESILEGTKKDIDGYSESPIRFVILADSKSTDSDAVCSPTSYIILPGTVTYQFSLEIPGDPHLPAPFKNSLGSLVYRLVVYMKSSNDVYVEVGELVMRFNGHHNLLENVESIKPVTVEQFYKKSMFSRKKMVEAVFSLETSGYLSEEPVLFVLYVRNPKCIPLQLQVQLVQHLKYDASGRRDSAKRKLVVVASKEKDCYEPEPEFTWIDSLTSRDNQEPSYDLHLMHSVSYTMQFQVRVLDHGTIKGEAPIYIGTTRDPIQVLIAGANTLNVPCQGIRRRGSTNSTHSARSHSSATTTFSLPPAYSQLSSRIPSIETLPPAYDEVRSLEGCTQELTLQVPQLTYADQVALLDENDVTDNDDD